ncbi:hypothetical protein CRX72_21515 [Pantoea sp. BRM17]|nr:hypothetical protein CRX72_21515 [Pantoea sp. BRM17]
MNDDMFEFDIDAQLEQAEAKAAEKASEVSSARWRCFWWAVALLCMVSRRCITLSASTAAALTVWFPAC